MLPRTEARPVWQGIPFLMWKKENSPETLDRLKLRLKIRSKKEVTSECKPKSLFF